MNDAVIEPAVHPPNLGILLAKHVLLCDNTNPETFTWTFTDRHGGAWKDARGVLWCPKSLAQMGWRYVRAVARPNSKGRGGLQYPYVPDGAAAQSRIMTAVSAAVPPHLPGGVRADVCQDIIVEVLEKGIDLADIPALVERHIAKNYNQYDCWSKQYRSLDQPTGDGLRTLGEVLDGTDE